MENLIAAKETAMEAEDLDRVVGIARKLLPRGIDYENIAMDILIESWQNGHESPSRRFIRNRCWDALRRLKVEINANESFSLMTKAHAGNPEEEIDYGDLMNKLTSNLTNLEKKVVCYRFFMGVEVPEIARRLGIAKSKTYTTLTEALFKMRMEIHE